jgi:hypothetical protein
MYRAIPIICDGDGPIPQFRKYYARYYVSSDTTPEGDTMSSARTAE